MQAQRMDLLLAKAALEIALAAAQARVAELEGERERLRGALEPLAAFGDLPSLRAAPDDMPLTSGSRMAARQIVVADARRAVAALAEPRP